MVSSNILTRVFQIKIGAATATAFSIEVEDRQYLITARHVVDASAPNTQLQVYRDASWQDIPYVRLEVEPPRVDIAVLALFSQISDTLPIELGFENTFLSEEVFFCGYPFGLSIEGKALNSGYPLPFVKRGIVAAFEFNGPDRCFFIDAINNPGFSGGPVVRSNSPNKPCIIGVVSGYRATQEPVLHNGVPTAMVVGMNTGLMVAYPLTAALEAIYRNPVGSNITKP